ncbi:progestin and adipoQ receptor family member 4 [Drosophila takahashii]|uniref:progestin and adipoQ receptor family member 4 n=1 Tax=Drosophila takahashii TaxID=29030 RepID=UPI001CF88715|nr:progestin and adipoQ receptor family member 4 isoform X2 [Drosophila takahashii]
MDTAAAAAAAVAVELKPDQQLLKATRIGGGAVVTGTPTGCDCLGSTVETMSLTPPPTPPSRASDSLVLHVEPGAPPSGSKEAASEATATASSTETTTQPDLPASSSSTSSAKASTKPTSALQGSGLGLGSVSASSSVSVEHPPAAAAAVAPPPESESSENVVQLLPWQDMPTYLQFNPYVLRGYRPLQTFKGCLLSLFYWHNETINILTHAIPIFYILAIVPGLMPWDSGYKFLSFCHVFGSVAPWCGSFVYHLFMNIEKGENVYYTLLKLDMVGIWVSQSFGALPLVTATTLCFPPVLKWLIIVSYCVLSLWGLYKALTASSPWQRRLCFALPFAMRSILTFLRIRGMVGGSHMALSHVYLQDGVSILGGAIGAMRIPEKWFPGVVDFYLNSHNIMHVLVVVAVYSMHKATIKDFEWMSTQTCHTDAANVTEQALGHVEL